MASTVAKVAAIIVGTVAVVTSVWAIDDRYFEEKEVEMKIAESLASFSTAGQFLRDSDLELFNHEIDDVYVDEDEIVGVLKNFDQSIQRRISELERSNKYNEYHRLKERHYQLQTWLSRNPNDAVAKNELDWVNSRLRLLEVELGI